MCLLVRILLLLRTTRTRVYLHMKRPRVRITIRVGNRLWWHFFSDSFFSLPSNTFYTTIAVGRAVRDYIFFRIVQNIYIYTVHWYCFKKNVFFFFSSAGERPYRCHLAECGRAFIQLSNLQQHLRNHDAQVERAKNRPFHCTICGKGFATESSLRTHTAKVSAPHVSA